MTGIPLTALSASVTSVEVQLRHTDDDPAGTPAWSEWERIDSGEYEARGFEFRAILRTTDTRILPADKRTVRRCRIACY